MVKLFYFYLIIASILIILLSFREKKSNKDDKKSNINKFIIKKFINHSKTYNFKENSIKFKYYLWEKNNISEIKEIDKINKIVTGKITKKIDSKGFMLLENVLVLRDGFVCNNVGFTINDNCPRKNIDVFNYQENETFPIINNAIALTSSYSAYVYHSIIEGLSKYMPFYLNNKYIDFNVIISTSVYKTNAAFEVMKILEIPVNKISFTPIIVKNLIIPFPGTCGFSVKSNIMQLSNLLISKIKKKSNRLNSKLLLLRRSRGRRYSSFEKIYKLVKELFVNKQILVYDDRNKYKYIDILLMFYESSIVIGVHGAGFSNAIACRKNTIILEIITNCLNHCFEILSEQLELRFIRYIYNKTNYLSNKVEIVDINFTDFREFLVEEVITKYDFYYIVYFEN